MSKRMMLVGLIAVMLVTAVAPVAAQPNRPRNPIARPLLGIQYADVDGEAVITRVLPGSPAEEAGLAVDDVIMAVNGEAVEASSIAAAIGALDAGNTVTLSVRRGEETLEIEAMLNDEVFGFQERAQLIGGAFMGVSLELNDAGKLVVTDIVADGPAATAGIQVGDLLVTVGEQEVSDVSAVVDLLAERSPGDIIQVIIERDGETLTLDVELGSRFAPNAAFNVTIPFGGDGVEYDAEAGTWTVVELDENSILAEAGLQIGDVVTAIDGEAFSPQDVPGMRGFMHPERTVTLTIQRGGETIELEAPALAAVALMLSSGEVMGAGRMVPDHLGPFSFRFGDPNERGFQFRMPDGQQPRMFRFGNRAFLGVTFVTLNEETAEEHDTDVTEGALILDVLADSPADKAGLEAGDVVVAVEGDTVDSRRTLAERISAYDPGESVTLDVVRSGETLEINVILSEPIPFAIPVVPAEAEQPGV